MLHVGLENGGKLPDDRDGYVAAGQPIAGDGPNWPWPESAGYGRGASMDGRRGIGES
jgi:hypothetical protein